MVVFCNLLIINSMDEVFWVFTVLSSIYFTVESQRIEMMFGCKWARVGRGLGLPAPTAGFLYQYVNERVRETAGLPCMPLLNHYIQMA
jgi:hypothetical protein